MKNVKLHSVTGKDDDSFIGIKIKNNLIDLYYPETYNLSSPDNLKSFREEVLSILKTINIAKTLSNDKAKIESSLVDNNFALLSYLWIINDYLVNGIYVNREKVFKKNQRGKINWKRTMNNQPIVSNGNVIYNNIVVEIRNNRDNILVDIHRYCVKKSIEIIGWLFKLNSSRIEAKPYNNAIKKVYIKTLNDELDKTFDDYKKMRLSHMLKVVRGLDGDNNANEFVYGVDSYYYVYERMIDSIFGNQKDLKEFNPKANWYLARDNFNKIQSSELRPDSILIKGEDDYKIAYILDSKYYRYGFTADSNDLPETSSIQKQITYGEYLKENNNLKVNEIRNAFILPYNCYNNKFNSEEIIHYIGFSMAEWKKNDKNKYESIYAFLVDTKHVISYWSNVYHNDDVDDLVTKIEKAVLEKDFLKASGKV